MQKSAIFKSITISHTFECTTNSCTAEVQEEDSRSNLSSDADSRVDDQPCYFEFSHP